MRDDQFTKLLHETLQAWGIGRRGSRLVPLTEFRRSLVARLPELSPLGSLSLEDPTLDLTAVVRTLDRLISELAVVDNRARIVAGTKTLHHLLPSLVPPMDRAWTGVRVCPSSQVRRAAGQLRTVTGTRERHRVAVGVAVKAMLVETRTSGPR